MNGSLIDYFAEQGRAPSFDRRGNVRGFRSRPGAPQAANDSMVNAFSADGPRNRFGFTSRDSWDAKFHPEKAAIEAADPWGVMTGKANQLKPRQPFDAGAPAAPQPGGQPVAALAPTPQQMAQQAANITEQWFDRNKIPIPIPGRTPAGRGSSFKSKFGWGFSTPDTYG